MSRGRREPSALLPAPAARLIGFALLAALAVAQWGRMIEGLGLALPGLWTAVGAAAGAAVWACDRLSPRWRGAAVLGVALAALLAAVPAAGLDAGLLRPRRWDELGEGLVRGADALAAVRLPYAGVDPWPALTLQLTGALLCILAGLLALWPRETGRGYPFLALVALLVLAASPVVSLGGTRPLLFGAALAAVVVCFLWLERLPLRPGFGVAALVGIALAGALPLAGAADREDPWFDYQTFAEGIGPENPVRFDWRHSYGPITWPRDRRELLRIRAREPEYWKAADLDTFDGVAWRERSPDEITPSGFETTQPPSVQLEPSWTRSYAVSVRRLRTTDVVGSGTILGVSDASRRVERAQHAGRWRAPTELRRGDTYRVRAFTPRPERRELVAAGSGTANQRADDLVLRVPVRGGSAVVRFPAFGVPGGPRADDPERGSGEQVLRGSAYARTWRLSQRLRARSRTPIEYIAAVERHLRRAEFTYSEAPTVPSPGTAPLEGFLFDTRDGYCQHYSGAMAMLLRMAGVPARVASGFSPGGYSRRSREWVVRDTDAHSWVEAWFDRYGWVTFDPTPADTPARSQIAAPPAPSPQEAADQDAAAAPPAAPGLRRDLLEDSTGRGVGSGAEPSEAPGAADGAPARWWLVSLAVLLAGGLGGGAVLHRRRRGPSGATPLDRAIAELDDAFRRSGRPTPPGTTLRQLEQRLKGSEEAVAYVRALRSARYGARAEPPTPAQRRAVRRELAYGLGWFGRLRALWALPPRGRPGRGRVF